MQFLIDNRDLLLALIYGLSGVIGIPLYLTTFYRFHKLSGWLPKNALLFHLAFMMSNFIIVMFTPYWAASGILKSSPTIAGGAEYVSYICLLSGINSMIMLFCLSFERFGDVFNKKWYNRLTMSRLITVVLAVFLFASVWSLPPLLGYAKFDKQPSNLGCLYNWMNFDHEHVAYIIINICVFFGLLIPAAFYLLIRCFVFQKSANFGPTTRTATLLRLMLRILFNFLLAWTPFLMSNIYGVLRITNIVKFATWETELQLKEFYFLPAAWLKLSLAMMPLVYLWTLPGSAKSATASAKTSRKANPYKTKNANKKLIKEKKN